MVSQSSPSASHLMYDMLICAFNQWSLSVEAPFAALTLSPPSSAVSSDDLSDSVLPIAAPSDDSSNSKLPLFTTSRFLPAGPDFGFEDFSVAPSFDFDDEAPYHTPFIPTAPRPVQTSSRYTRSARYLFTIDRESGPRRSRSTSFPFSSIAVDGGNEDFFG